MAEWDAESGDGRSGGPPEDTEGGFPSARRTRAPIFIVPMGILGIPRASGLRLLVRQSGALRDTKGFGVCTSNQHVVTITCHQKKNIEVLNNEFC